MVMALVRHREDVDRRAWAEIRNGECCHEPEVGLGSGRHNGFTVRKACRTVLALIFTMTVGDSQTNCLFIYI